MPSTRKIVNDLSLGLIDGLNNIVLYAIESGGFNESDKLLNVFSPARIQKAVYNLSQANLIKLNNKAKHKQYILTKQGLKRLQGQIPFYDEQRSWDNKLYLVTYDFQIKHNQRRDAFRKALISLSAVMIQQSVYLTPYNPHSTILKLNQDGQLNNQIVVSELKQSGIYGEALSFKELVWKIYNLEDINNKYALFIGRHSHYKAAKVKRECLHIAFEYLAILKEDPQLPFNLLSSEYLGKQAYTLYLKLLKKANY